MPVEIKERKHNPQKSALVAEGIAEGHRFHWGPSSWVSTESQGQVVVPVRQVFGKQEVGGSVPLLGLFSL